MKHYSLLSLSILLALFSRIALSTDVTTYHNDNFRTGQNLQETILTTSNVKSATFGKVGFISMDGVIDAEPVYLSKVSIPSKGTHNILFVVTENDSVYAVDADTGKTLWKVSTLQAGESPSGTFGCSQISPQIGITSTPVIDRSSGPHGTIYVVAMSRNSGNYFQRLHAFDITTGKEEFGGPITVSAKYPGSGDGSQGGYVIFNPAQYAERQGLLLFNHVVYTGWTSHCDARPYTGWVIGYDEKTLAQSSVLNLTPNGSEGSIWQAGGGMAAVNGSIFVLTANGTFDTTLNSKGFPTNGDFGNAFVRISTQNNNLKVADYFTMSGTVQESDQDEDLGSGGAMLVPPQTDASGQPWYLGVGAGKDGNIYVVNAMNMGKFNPDNDYAIYQEIDGALSGGIWGTPAYFLNSIYYGPVGNRLLQFKFTDAKLSTSPTSKSATSFTYPGTSPSVSANGSGNGIVWTIEHSDPIDVLHAYAANNLGMELYNTTQAGNSRDAFGMASHFGTPMIVNGKVYVGTTNGVAVFGLLGKATSASNTPHRDTH